MHYVQPRQPKGSHNQSFEISFRRAWLKREKSRLGFIIPTIVPGSRSKAQFSPPLLRALLLRRPPFADSYHSPSPFQFPPKFARFLEAENHIRLDAACIPSSTHCDSCLCSPSSPPPNERPMHGIIATKPCYKAVHHHKGLFNP